MRLPLIARGRLFVWGGARPVDYISSIALVIAHVIALVIALVIAHVIALVIALVIAPVEGPR